MHAPLKLLPARFQISGKMEANMSAGECLAALFAESGMSSDGEDSDFGAEGIFCYNPGGVPGLSAAGGGEDLDEEDADISDGANSGLPVPTEFRDQAEGEY